MKHGGLVALSVLGIMLGIALPERAEAQTATSTAAPATATVTTAPVSTSTRTASRPKRKRRYKPSMASTPEEYRNPRGRIILEPLIGLAYEEGEGTTFLFGLQIGYAVLTGVVPGFRGVFITTPEGAGGEVAGSLTLTPPLSWSITPYVQGEAGRRFDPDLEAWFYGVNGGAYIGDPASRVALRVGYRWQRFITEDEVLEDTGPVLAVSFFVN